MSMRNKKIIFIYRIIAFFISLCGVLLHFLSDTVVESGFMIQHKMAYFTIQTNILIVLLFMMLLWQSIRGYQQNGKWGVGVISPKFYGAIIVYIIMTMLVFWVILAPITGIPTNHFLLMNTLILHLVTPLLAIVDFIFFYPHGYFRKKYIILWLSYPIAYVLFVILYSNIIKKPYYSFQIGTRTIELMYPYPFLDIKIMSIWGVGLAIILLLISFYMLAQLIIFIDKKLASVEYPECFNCMKKKT